MTFKLILGNLKENRNTLKETRDSIKKEPLNLWWTWNKTIMEVGNITKAATFKSFIHLSYKNTQLLLLWQRFLIIFIRQTLTDYFWGPNENMNCAFPLRLIKFLIFSLKVFEFEFAWGYLFLQPGPFCLKIVPPVMLPTA